MGSQGPVTSTPQTHPSSWAIAPATQGCTWKGLAGKSVMWNALHTRLNGTCGSGLEAHCLRYRGVDSHAMTRFVFFKD